MMDMLGELTMISKIKEIKQRNHYDFSHFTETDIENTANEILNEFKYNNDDCLRIVSLVESLGFLVFEYPMERNNISGMIGVDMDLKETKGSDKIIFINENDSYARQRFTIAHELAHYIFDFNENLSSAYYNAYDTLKENAEAVEEKRANRFAAALLMPSKRFYELFEQCQQQDRTHYETVAYLCHQFKISRTAVEYRIRELSEL